MPALVLLLALALPPVAAAPLPDPIPGPPTPIERTRPMPPTAPASAPVPDAQSPVVWLEVRRANGTVERATGADATALWRGIVRALDVAQSYGYPYAGPRLAYVAAPAVDNPGEVAPALEGEGAPTP